MGKDAGFGGTFLVSMFSLYVGEAAKLERYSAFTSLNV